MNFIDLSKFINKPHELSKILCSSGFNVDSWEKKNLDQVFIAEIKQKKLFTKHLSLCQVEAYKNKIYSIVCGASNFKVGDKVVLALEGAVLSGSFKIQNRKIQGELSEGMLASLSELGLSTANEKEEGIFILPKEVKVGTCFADYIGLKDTIFDIDITPNRADCLSHFGMARELACILNQDFTADSLDNKKSQQNIKPFLQKAEYSLSVSCVKGALIKSQLEVQNKNPQLCTRYTGRAVYGVQVKPSPLWLKCFLENLGFKSINNIVDITNYFLIQWGQPLHAFDLDICQKKIIIDFSQNQEVLETLDNQKITLTGTELCIKDNNKTLALAGVIGGLNSGIQNKTKNIFVEAACFDPIHIRKVAKKFNIETDSAFRFSRGVSAENTLEVLHRAVAFIQDLAGGEISSDEYDFKQKTREAKTIEIQEKDICRRLGMDISFLTFQNWIKKLHCQVKIEDNIAKVIPPLFRFDLNIKEDLIEEYARLEGYDKIPEKISYLKHPPKSDDKQYTLSVKIAQILEHEGFYQAINHSFISQEFSDSFLAGSNTPLSYHLNTSPVLVQNPLSLEYNMMRVSLAPSLFKNVQRSMSYGSLQGRLFELGKVFTATSLGKTSNSKSETKKNRYLEDSHLGFIAWGQEENLWKKNKERLCIYDLKSAIQTLLDVFNIQDYEWAYKEKAPAFIHPYQYKVLKVQNKAVAYVGSLNPFYAEYYKTRVNIALAEINLSFLTQIQFKNKSFQNVSAFPLVKRDLSFLIPKEFPVEEVIKGIQKQAGSVCRKIEIFDIYENEQTNKEGVRAVAFRLILQSDTKTLTEEHLKIIQEKITQKMVSQYPIKLR